MPLPLIPVAVWVTSAATAALGGRLMHGRNARSTLPARGRQRQRMNTDLPHAASNPRARRRMVAQ
jgi:hypothetical protein